MTTTRLSLVSNKWGLKQELEKRFPLKTDGFINPPLMYVAQPMRDRKVFEEGARWLLEEAGKVKREGEHSWCPTDENGNCLDGITEMYEFVRLEDLKKLVEGE